MNMHKTVRFSRAALLGLSAMLLASCANLSHTKTKSQPRAADLAVANLPSAQPMANPLETVREEHHDVPRPPLPEFNQPGSLPPLPVSTASMPEMPKVAAADDIVVLDYEQTDLRQILEELASVLGISMVIDSSIADKVTVRTSPDKPLKQKDIWPLLQLLMTDAGIMMERQGEVYYVKKMPLPVPPDIGSRGNAERSTAPEVMQITPLRYISAESALEAVRPLLDQQGRLVSLPTLNIIGVVTAPPRLQRINQLLSLLDADPFQHRGIRLYRLSNAKASEIQEDLGKILQAVEGAKPSYAIVALERINAILAIAPPNRGFEQVSQWVRILDEKNDEGGEQVFIYRVRNLKAASLASTLSEVFKSDDDKTAKSKPPQVPGVPPEALQNPNEPPPEAPTPPPEGQTLKISAELKVTIVADEDTNSLLVRARPRDYRQLLETITVLDQVPKEVMINAVIAEVSLSENTRFGVDWGYFFGSRGFVGTNFGIAGTDRLRADNADSKYDKFNFANLSGLVLRDVGDHLTAMLNLVGTDNNVQLLSRPSILVRNNQEATMNVGSDEPTITRINTSTQSALNSNFSASNEVQYRQTGITLKVTPHINEDGIINMDIFQEISSLGAERTEQKLPSFTQRKIETSVVVRDGSAIVLGGLIQRRATNTQAGLPGLMDVPLLGKLFADNSNAEDRVELVVILVPQIIRPDADNRDFVRAFNNRMEHVNSLLNDSEVPLFWNWQTPMPAPKPAPTQPAPSTEGPKPPPGETPDENSPQPSEPMDF